MEETALPTFAEHVVMVNVAQIGHTRGRVRATGREFDVPETHVLTVRNDKIARFGSYIDTAMMREALGL